MKQQNLRDLVQSFSWSDAAPAGYRIDYLYETSWSLRVSRPVLLLAATSGFNEVIEFGSFVAVCQLVAGDEPRL
jgi:hypothetical protein